MDWKNEAMEKLKQYADRRQALESIPAEIRRLEGEMAALQAGADTSQAARDAAMDNIALREELARRLASAKSWVDQVDGGLAQLEEEERQILDAFYIHRRRGHVERLCESLCLERKAVYTHKDRALRRFTLCMYGLGES